MKKSAYRIEGKETGVLFSDLEWESTIFKGKAGGFKYHYRPVPCSRCGSRWFRANRGDCRDCRRLFAQSWHIVRVAVWAAIHGRPICSRSAQLIGTDSESLREIILRECAEIGVSIFDYGKLWGIYRKIPLSVFELNRQIGEANLLNNLCVRLLHNRKRKEKRPQNVTDSLFELEKANK